MDEKKPVAATIRPFGAVGGRYEVDASGLFQYRLCAAFAVVAIGVLIFGEYAGLSRAMRYGIWAVCFALVAGLSIWIVRNGRKL